MKKRKFITGVTVFHYHKAKLSLFYEDYSKALNHIKKGEKTIQSVMGFPYIVKYCFLAFLSFSGCYPEMDSKEKACARKRLKKEHKQMKKWADHCPVNFLHRKLIMEAEMVRLSDKPRQSADIYDEAIKAAKENEWLSDEALANELAAKFYLERGQEKIASVYMKEASYLYARWGAARKVEFLEETYPQLFTRTTGKDSAALSATYPTTGSSVLDLNTVMKASRSISGEIRLERLLDQLMKNVIENAGAQKGLLILENEGEFFIEAEKDAGESEIKVLHSEAVSLSRNLSVGIINLVARTKTDIVLNDAVNEGKFINDPYIMENRPKSVQCSPVICHGRLMGMIYLENNLVKDAFTPERVEVIRLLSSQAAISIENAMIYQELDDLNKNLEQKVEERTRELVESAKMAALGQLIAGVAHEINNPIGAIRSSARNISEILDQTLNRLPAFFRSLPGEYHGSFLSLMERALRKDMSISAKEERKFKRKLTRKLEDLDLEDADTAADTLTDMGIYDNVGEFLPLLEYEESEAVLETAYNLSGLRRNSQTIGTATDRTSKIVYALKNYARSEASAEPVRAEITEGIETVLTLYHSQLKHGIEVIRNYEELPAVMCHPDELNQVWTNLVHNAIQAMGNRGTLTIDLRRENDRVAVTFTDSGKGIPDEIRERIFEPFFTTKPPGEGIGLGLDIARKIIEKHNGDIRVESEPGRTAFTVILPLKK